MFVGFACKLGDVAPVTLTERFVQLGKVAVALVVAGHDGTASDASTVEDEPADVKRDGYRKANMV